MENENIDENIVVMPESGSINNPNDCLDWIPSSLRNAKTESFGVIFLDSGRNVISRKILFKGGTSRCFVDSKVVFWEACRKRASAVILFHNHPGGNPAPSPDDYETTSRLAKAGEIVGVQVLDHIIVAKYEFHSFLECGDMEKLDKAGSLVAEK